jgi:hypothetical protein
MSDTWNRASFRVGGQDYGLLAEMHAQEMEQETERQGEGGGRDEGAGAASFSAGPKILPGDELYETFYQAQVETLQQEAVARQAEATNGNDGGLLATMLAAEALGSNQQPQQEGYAAAAQETTQPAPEAEQVATFHSLKAEQAAAMPAPEPAQQQAEAPVMEEAPHRPGEQAPEQTGLMADFVTAETQQEAADAQAQALQRSQYAALVM